jgi:hypothetical protein
MSWKAMKPWFGPCLLGLTLSLGCKQIPTRRDATPASEPAAHPVAADKAPAAPASRALDSVSDPVLAAAIARVPAVAPSAPPVLRVNAPEPRQVEPPVPEPRQAEQPVPEPRQAEPPAPANAPDQPVIVNGPTAPATETPPEKDGKPLIDPSSLSGFSHAPDYSSLNGQVEYSRLSRGWRLRYAAVDEVDRYGGSVTLVENADLDRLQDGQYLCVQGHLTNPDATGPSPAYRVDSFTVVAQPAPVDAPAGPR